MYYISFSSRNEEIGIRVSYSPVGVKPDEMAVPGVVVDNGYVVQDW